MGRFNSLILNDYAAPCTLSAPKARGFLLQPPHINTPRPLHHTSHRQTSLVSSIDTHRSQSVACKAASERLSPAGQGHQRQSAPSPPVYPGLVLELDCARLALEGKGVCLLPPTGFVVLVERTLPGERVRTEVQEVKRGYAEARKLASLAPHRHAVAPICPYFGPCGGCSLQSLEYQAQLGEKRNQVEQTLRRVGRLGAALDALAPIDTASGTLDDGSLRSAPGTAVNGHDTTGRSGRSSRSGSSSRSGIENGERRESGGAVAVRSTAGTGSSSRMGGVSATVGCNEPFAYRNKMTFHFSSRCWEPSQGAVVDRPALGFLRPGSADVVLPVVRHGCALQTPAANNLVSRVHELVSEHQFLPYNDPSKKGFLKQLVIRRSSGAHLPGAGRPPNGSTASATTSVGYEDEYMVVFGVTDGSVGRRLQPVADALAREFPQLASVVVQQLAPVVITARFPRGSDQRGGRGGGQGREKHARRRRGCSDSGALRGSMQIEDAEGIAATTDHDNSGENRSDGADTLLYGTPHIHDSLCGLTFRISASSFFQTNSRQAEVLYSIVRQAVELRESDALLDLYCGTGSIGLSLAADCRVVLGVEVAETAVSDARRNTSLNGITNAFFLCADVDELPRAGELLRQQYPLSQHATSNPPQREHQGTAAQSVSRRPLVKQQQPTSIPRSTGTAGEKVAGARHVADGNTDTSCMVEEEGPAAALGAATAANAVGVAAAAAAAVSPDVVVVDPARAGLSATTVSFLTGCGARRVVYVSCNVATQARDLDRLCNGPGGAYRVVSVTPVDMFPHTDHVETVVVLERKKAGEKGMV